MQKQIQSSADDNRRDNVKLMPRACRSNLGSVLSNAAYGHHPIIRPMDPTVHSKCTENELQGFDKEIEYFHDLIEKLNIFRL